jgi:hypothetical protein
MSISNSDLMRPKRQHICSAQNRDGASCGPQWSLRELDEFLVPADDFCPDGQIKYRLGLWSVQPLREKYSAFAVGQINFRTPAVHPTKGRIAIVTDAGLDAMDADARLTKRADADGEAVWS